MAKRVLQAVRHGVLLALLTSALQAQQAPAAATAPGDTARPLAGQKSPVAAAALGLVLAGAGHWYAGERGRGALVAAVYWAGVAVVAGGRTDRVGHVGGIALLGALSFSVVDGALAAARFNRRRAAAPQPGAPDSLKGAEAASARNEALPLTGDLARPRDPVRDLLKRR